jgi:ABC-type bacteriocin/lantibiotic exporter with double-glycine peptidase domain
MLVFANGIYSVSLNETGKLNSTDHESPEANHLDVTYDSQDTSYTCGPSSLKMAFSVYGLDLDEKWLANAAQTTYQGTNEEDLIKATETVNSVYGTNLTAHSEKFTDWGRLNSYVSKKIPVILYVQSWYNPDGGHYVVLTGVDEKNGYASIADPSGGVKNVPLSDLENRMQWVMDNYNVAGTVVPIMKN